MPIYAYLCNVCGGSRDVWKRIADLDRNETCQECATPGMVRRVTAPAVRGDYEGYRCPITDKWIEGRRAHMENLRKHGCRVLEPGEREGLTRQRAQEEAAFDASIDNTVQEFVETLPTRKREQLAAEIDNGLDLQVTRG